MGAGGEILNLPRNLYLESTNRCNLRCRGCILYQGNWEEDRDMTLQDMVMITDQLPALERAVLHGVGEPLLNRALPLMIRHLKKRKIFVAFNSNGILLSETWQNDLIDAGLDELRISLDAASPEGYYSMRGSMKFDQIIQNLKGFIKVQKMRHREKPGLSLWYLGNKVNIAQLPDFVRLAADIGVVDVHLQRLVYFQDHEGYGVARRDMTLWGAGDGSLEWIRKSQDIAETLGIRFNASGLSRPVDSVRGGPGDETPWRNCYRPSTLMYITSGGNVLPCCISPFSTRDYRSIILGNVFENSLEAIWSGARYNHFRKMHQTESPPGCCRGCGVLWSL